MPAGRRPITHNATHACAGGEPLWEGQSGSNGHNEMEIPMKKFYVGSKSTIVNGDWTHQTVDGAINHAKRLLQESDEEQYVVKVIRIVKRRSLPIVVDTV